MKGLLVGYGSIGRRHLANFHDLGVQDWAVVHTGSGTLQLQPPCPVRTFSSVEQSLRSEKPDFAVIANPNNLHVRAALACVQADVHVLVEKPLSDTPEGIPELAAALKEKSAKLLVGFQFRFHPAVQRIQGLLSARAIGRTLHARAVWGEHLPGWHPWEDYRIGYAARADLGGGVHHTICHPLDYLRLLFGEATCVAATLETHGPLELDVAEAAEITLRFDDGVHAQVHLDYWAQPAMHRLEIIGTEGTLYWDYPTGALGYWSTPAGAWTYEQYPGVADRNELFVSEARHFLEVVKGRAEPVCTLADGVAAMQLCAEIESRDAA